jgi:hypothetical protein
MAVLVDHPRWDRGGTRYAHLASDRSHRELHEFVAGLELGPAPRLPFHEDHYDVPAAWWPDVVAAGATVVTTRELVRRLRAAGLRRSR